MSHVSDTARWVAIYRAMERGAEAGRRMAGIVLLERRDR